MHVRWLWIGLALAAPALGQQTGRQAAAPSEAQSEKRDESQKRALDGMLRRAAERLDLDEQQKAKFDELVTELKKELGAARGARAARQSGAEEQEDQKPEAEESPAGEPQAGEGKAPKRGGRRSSAAILARFYDRLEPILREDQIEKLDELRGGGAQFQRPPSNPLARVRRLRGELDLKPEQGAEFDRLYAELEARLNNKGDDDPDVLALVEKLREAVERGDRAELAAVREQIMAKRSGGDGAIEWFYEELSKSLTPEQREKLDQRRSQSGRGRHTDARTLLRLAGRLQLEGEQRDQLREIERETREKLRETRGDKAASEALDRAVEEKIRALLTAEQVTEFDRLIERQRPGRSSAERGRQLGRGQAEQDEAADEDAAAPEDDEP